MSYDFLQGLLAGIFLVGAALLAVDVFSGSEDDDDDFGTPIHQPNS